MALKTNRILKNIKKKKKKKIMKLIKKVMPKITGLVLNMTVFSLMRTWIDLFF